MAMEGEGGAGARREGEPGRLKGGSGEREVGKIVVSNRAKEKLSKVCIRVKDVPRRWKESVELELSMKA
jgi:hypothetical protein